METQTRLSRHNKFISAENIIIFSVSRLRHTKDFKSGTCYLLA